MLASPSMRTCRFSASSRAARPPARPAGPASSSAGSNNGVRGSQYGRPRHTHRLRVRAATAAPTRSPSFPPFPGRNEALIKQPTSKSQTTAPSSTNLLLPLPTKWRLLRARKRAGDYAANEDAAARASTNETAATACCWGRLEECGGGCCRGLKSCGRSMSGITAQPRPPRCGNSAAGSGRLLLA